MNMRKKSGAPMYPPPQWIQNLDPEKPHHALALRSFHHKSSRLSDTSCSRCVKMNLACFTASAVSARCVKCIASGHVGCDANSSNTDEDGVVLVDVKPLDRDETLGPSTTSTVTETITTHAEKPKLSSKTGRKPTRTSELAALVFAPASIVGTSRKIAGSEEEPPEESRLDTRTKSNDDRDALKSNSPKRRRRETSTTSEAATEVRKPRNTVEPPSVQSSPFPMSFMVSPERDGHFSSVHQIPLPSTPGISINPTKQNNTTLWISIPSSPDAVPLKLRSCLTVSSLFDSVLTICGLAEQEAKVSGLRTTLSWKQIHDVKKS